MPDDTDWYRHAIPPRSLLGGIKRRSINSNIFFFLPLFCADGKRKRRKDGGKDASCNFSSIVVYRGNWTVSGGPPFVKLPFVVLFVTVSRELLPLFHEASSANFRPIPKTKARKFPKVANESHEYNDFDFSSCSTQLTSLHLLACPLIFPSRLSSWFPFCSQSWER